MSRQGRVWLLFVIVAVGLALSWGQVGRNTQRAIEDRPVVLLRTEQPCRPRAAPCAAVAEDRALVLGPAGRGLAVKAVGWRIEDIARIEAVALADDGTEIPVALPVRDHEGWSVPMPPAAAALLRVRVEQAREATVADFPL
jgi:hypothetical protein